MVFLIVMADGSATYGRQIHSHGKLSIQLERPQKLSNDKATTASAGSTDDFKSGISGNGYLVPENPQLKCLSFLASSANPILTHRGRATHSFLSMLVQQFGAM